MIHNKSDIKKNIDILTLKNFTYHVKTNPYFKSDKKQIGYYYYPVKQVMEELMCLDFFIGDIYKRLDYRGNTKYDFYSEKNTYRFKEVIPCQYEGIRIVETINRTQNLWTPYLHMCSRLNSELEAEKINNKHSVLIILEVFIFKKSISINYDIIDNEYLYDIIEKKKRFEKNKSKYYTPGNCLSFERFVSIEKLGVDLLVYK